MIDFCGSEAAGQEKRFLVQSASSDEGRAQLRANSEQNTDIETD